MGKYDGCTSSHTDDAVSLAAEPLLKTLMFRIRKILSGDGWFDWYVVTFYGGPSSAEAESIVLRIVKNDW